MTDAAHDLRNDEAITLDAAAEALVEACEGDAMAAVRALVASNAELEREVARLSGKVSNGYTRGRTRV